MRRVSEVLRFLIVIGLLSACDPQVPTQSAAPADPPAARWAVLPITTTKYPAATPGWQVVRVDLAVENQSQHFAAPTIATNNSTADTKIITDKQAYSAETYQTTGSITHTVSQIAFQAMLPPGFSMKGEYQSDAVVSYCFVAKIPTSTVPLALSIPGFKSYVSLTTTQTIAFPSAASQQTFSEPNSGFKIPQSVDVTFGNFHLKQWWPTNHDLITTTVAITSENDTGDENINLKYWMIGDNGIVGTQYLGLPECQTNMRVGPRQHTTTELCVLLPHIINNNIKLIVYGDYEGVFNVRISP